MDHFTYKRGALHAEGVAIAAIATLAAKLGPDPQAQELLQAAQHAAEQGRHPVGLGRDALDLVEGKMAFAVVHGKLKMTRIEAPEPIAEPASEPVEEASE